MNRLKIFALVGLGVMFLAAGIANTKAVADEPKAELDLSAYIPVVDIETEVKGVEYSSQEYARELQDVTTMSGVTEAHEYVVTSLVPMDDDWQCYAQYLCEMYTVSYPLVLAICEHESRFQEDVVNASGNNIGLMQINPRWFGSYMDEAGIDKEQLKNRYANVEIGIMWLSDLFKKYEEPTLVLQAYHGEALTGSSSYASYVLERADYYTQIIYGGQVK